MGLFSINHLNSNYYIYAIYSDRIFNRITTIFSFIFLQRTVNTVIRILIFLPNILNFKTGAAYTELYIIKIR